MLALHASLMLSVNLSSSRALATYVARVVGQGVLREALRHQANASNTTTNSSATSNTLPPSAPAGSLSRRVPVQAMLTCFYSLHGDFLSEGQLLAPDNIDKIRHIPHPASQCKEPPTSSARPALCLTCRRLGRR